MSGTGARVRKFKQLHLLGVALDVTWDTASMPADSKEDYGESLPEDRRVHINLPRHKTSEAAERTLFHELMHCVLALTGQDQHLDEKTEEGVIRALEHGMYPAICELVELGYFRKPKPAEAGGN